ncbi:MAG: flagellar M-ring protein FliF C-terminal domain-containing protein [Desulfobacteria bacterium]
MKRYIEQFGKAFRAMPVTKKAILISVVALVVAGFVFMFVWANRIDYQSLYTSISSEDAGHIVSKLKEKKIPFKLEANGSTVLAPAGKEYELGLAMAGDRLPRREDGFLADMKFNYQQKLERMLAESAQTMLEAVLGRGKAVVRVNAEMDFDKTEIREEIYDPGSAVVTRRQRQAESSEQGGDDAVDEILTYEINKIKRHIIKPFGTLKRLSVAVVLDGTYRMTTDEDGAEVNTYIPRTPKELKEIEGIVAKAIGYYPDRGDQISISSFRFSRSEEMKEKLEWPAIDWVLYIKKYTNTAINLLLVLIVFVCVVRPLIRSMREIRIGEYMRPDQTRGPEKESQPLELIEGTSDIKTMREITQLARQDPQTTQRLLRGWLNEPEPQ